MVPIFQSAVDSCTMIGSSPDSHRDGVAVYPWIVL